MNVKEMLVDALPIIKEFAPTIAGAIGGPVGMAAGYVVPILANAFEGKSSNLKDLSQKIISHPQCKDILCSLESEHNVTIQSLLNNLNDLASLEITIKLAWDTSNQG